MTYLRSLLGPPVMGNKPTAFDTSADVYSAHGRRLGSCLSEEKYIPMSLSMRKKLMENKRFRHVVPSREDRDYAVQISEHDVVDMSTLKNLLADVKENVEETNESESPSFENTQRNIDPVVTVMNINTIQNKSTTQVHPAVVNTITRRSSYDDANNKPEAAKHLLRSPTLTNRRYSLINIKTGLKKSKFTLELEEKLRQSKLNLGFDNDMNDWKEFTYRMENPESRLKAESLQKGNLKFGMEGNVGKGLEKVCLRDPLQYCAHNCQILGLCSVRSPNVLPKQEHLKPSCFEDEISDKHDNVLKILKGDFKHHKKDNCNCDHCTLAYLTEMGFPEENCSRRSVSIKVGRSPKQSPRSGKKRITERIRVIENENTMKSIEICVSGRQSTASDTLVENSSMSTMFSSEISEGDITNRKIKRMFQKNNAAMKEMYSNLEVMGNPNVLEAKQTSVDDFFKTSGCFNVRSEEVLQVQTDNRSAQFLTARSRSSGKKPFSSTLASNISSSLSSVLSYKRVRQIFQTIIERNRPRKRIRKNINKFRELEELGLGEVKNNRWYPSDSKTLSIWHGMHQSVQGIQAEFRKYPRTYLKRLD